MASHMMMKELDEKTIAENTSTAAQRYHYNPQPSIRLVHASLTDKYEKRVLPQCPPNSCPQRCARAHVPSHNQDTSPGVLERRPLRSRQPPQLFLCGNPLALSEAGAFNLLSHPVQLLRALADHCSFSRYRLFGFLLGTTLASAGTYYYILDEYRVSNELLTEDIYALQAAVQNVHNYVSSLEEKVDAIQKKK
ncbi:MAG: hypothetical protein Q9169_000691 [Polycauliona sp. 2 TL-2023]